MHVHKFAPWWGEPLAHYCPSILKNTQIHISHIYSYKRFQQAPWKADNAMCVPQIGQVSAPTAPTHSRLQARSQDPHSPAHVHAPQGHITSQYPPVEVYANQQHDQPAQASASLPQYQPAPALPQFEAATSRFTDAMPAHVLSYPPSSSGLQQPQVTDDCRRNSGNFPWCASQGSQGTERGSDATTCTMCCYLLHKMTLLLHRWEAG